MPFLPARARLRLPRGDGGRDAASSGESSFSHSPASATSPPATFDLPVSRPVPPPATITTAVAPTAYAMPSRPPSVQPLSISLDFFDMDDVSGEQHTPLSSTSSSPSSSDLGKPSPARKLKKRSSSSAKVLSTKRLSNAEKQAKNRLFVKRCYYKKREALKNLREEVAQLEGEFATVLQRWQQLNENSAEAFRDGKRRIAPQDLYAELTVVRGSLVEEQQRLNLRLADRHLFRQRLQQLYEPTR
ncbi:hypothetical protein PHYPSEUDO_003385 [Phytophthora pseudosyringae]|uniref:BZIP domain-containing protein n=1 Tax=Phytophthora pseudosyringae TaxID=221518 RepID=A0A8T1VRX6_9STRA|nr:hypothetical protein PHYPSEUDO_003385 [Phytophthora pseudosyringae]